MLEQEIRKYTMLNAWAARGGTVILGCDDDVNIPLNELRDAFGLGNKVYNRSAAGLSVTNAASYFDAVAAPLAPEQVLLHIGANDLDLLAQDAAAFDQALRSVVDHIRSTVKQCTIAIVACQNPAADKGLAEMNRHLAVIAQTEQCHFGDISHPRIWNPRETKTVMEFAHAMGLHRPAQKPLYDLVKVLFCYDA